MDKVDAAVEWSGGFARIFAGGLIFEMDFATRTVANPPISMRAKWPALPTDWEQPDATTTIPGKPGWVALIKGLRAVEISISADTIISNVMPLNVALRTVNCHAIFPKPGHDILPECSRDSSLS